MKLAAYLQENNLTPSAFAARIGSPASTVTRLLRGERSPGINLLMKIKVATHGAVTPDDFGSGTERADDERAAQPEGQAA